MATPLRFRHSPEQWSEGRVKRSLLRPLQQNLGASLVSPQVDIGGQWNTHRFEMDNGDIALFARSETDAYWIGNTETPPALWQTTKYGFGEVPFRVARWAERELLTRLYEETPWLEEYPYLSWFFLPVLLSKDGRHSTRAFFREHAAGFPDTSWEDGTTYVESFLSTGVLDPYREVMAGKLGTSLQVDRTRMSAAMAEIIAAKLLIDAGYDIVPEIEVSTGHVLDFRASNQQVATLVEVTRPINPSRRAAANATQAIRETVATKTDGQLERHGGGVVLFVDCTNFDAEQWERVRTHPPAIDHRPAVIYRARPGTGIEGYELGRVPLDLEPVLTPMSQSGS